MGRAGAKAMLAGCWRGASVLVAWWTEGLPKDYRRITEGVPEEECPANLEDGDGGAEGDRTPYLLVANEALYQMSYDPRPSTVGHGQ
jgi:hypothetical protein